MRTLMRAVWRSTRPAGFGLLLAFAPAVTLAAAADDPTAMTAGGPVQEHGQAHDEALVLGASIGYAF